MGWLVFIIALALLGGLVLAEGEWGCFWLIFIPPVIIAFIAFFAGRFDDPPKQKPPVVATAPAPAPAPAPQQQAAPEPPPEQPTQQQSSNQWNQAYPKWPGEDAPKEARREFWTKWGEWQVSTGRVIVCNQDGIQIDTHGDIDNAGNTRWASFHPRMHQDGTPYTCTNGKPTDDAKTVGQPS